MPQPDLRKYARVLVAMSGGKDSLACLLHLLEQDVPLDRIELHHHDVDGGRPFMDWPCTASYCEALAGHFGVPLYRSWRRGGILGELERNGDPTGEVCFEQPGGAIGVTGGSGPPGTRLRFPQVTADLRLRWCSAVAKIDVLAAAIRAQDRFYDGPTLVVTGERAEESRARAAYERFEAHRTSTKGGRRPPRQVDHWRPVHGWGEADVWRIIERHHLRPHPAYRLGFGRLSCLSCIFASPAQWATIRAVFPEHFARIAAREAATGYTIQRGVSVIEQASMAEPFRAALDQPELVAIANDPVWREPMELRPWRLPAGAFGEAAGPS